MKKPMIILFSIIFVAALVFAYFYFVQPLSVTTQAKRSVKVLDWLKNPEAHPDWAVSFGEQCEDAPFIFPTNGFIGYLWDDSFRPGHRHSGIDIFGGRGPGLTPVVSAYDGYLTRLADWKSTVIIRIPEDPLKPGRQIWTYYTHMADEQGIPLFLKNSQWVPVKFLSRPAQFWDIRETIQEIPETPPGFIYIFQLFWMMAAGSI